MGTEKYKGICWALTTEHWTPRLNKGNKNYWNHTLLLSLQCVMRKMILIFLFSIECVGLFLFHFRIIKNNNICHHQTVKLHATNNVRLFFNSFSTITQLGIGRGTLSCFNLHAFFCMIFHQNEHLCVVHNFSGDDRLDGIYVVYVCHMTLMVILFSIQFFFSRSFSSSMFHCNIIIIIRYHFFSYFFRTWQNVALVHIILAHSQHSHFRYSCVSCEFCCMLCIFAANGHNLFHSKAEYYPPLFHALALLSTVHCPSSRYNFSLSLSLHIHVLWCIIYYII